MLAYTCCSAVHLRNNPRRRITCGDEKYPHCFCMYFHGDRTVQCDHVDRENVVNVVYVTGVRRTPDK